MRHSTFAQTWIPPNKVKLYSRFLRSTYRPKLARLTRPSIRLRCAKIGSSLDSADMVENANSLMGIMSSSTRNPRMPSISQSFASNSMRDSSALMVTDACSDMNKENSKRFTITPTSTSWAFLLMSSSTIPLSFRNHTMVAWQVTF